MLLADRVTSNQYFTTSLWDHPDPVVVLGKSSTGFNGNWCGAARLTPREVHAPSYPLASSEDLIC